MARNYNLGGINLEDSAFLGGSNPGISEHDWSLNAGGGKNPGAAPVVHYPQNPASDTPNITPGAVRPIENEAALGWNRLAREGGPTAPPAPSGPVGYEDFTVNGGQRAPLGTQLGDPNGDIAFPAVRDFGVMKSTTSEAGRDGAWFTRSGEAEPAPKGFVAATKNSAGGAITHVGDGNAQSVLDWARSGGAGRVGGTGAVGKGEQERRLGEFRGIYEPGTSFSVVGESGTVATEVMPQSVANQNTFDTHVARLNEQQTGQYFNPQAAMDAGVKIPVADAAGNLASSSKWDTSGALKPGDYAIGKGKKPAVGK